MSKRYRRAAIALGATMALGGGLFAGLGPGTVLASSHREAPLVSADPQVDGTDLYAFRSPDKPNTITLISNWIPFEEPAGGPNFFAWADGVHYDINIDNNGDAQPDVIYRWTFTNHYRNPNTFLYNTGQVTSLDDTDLNFYQTYELDRITRQGGNQTKRVVANGTSAPSDVGDASMPDYPALSDSAITSFGPNGGSKVWAGQADDPFFLDLRVFDLAYGANLSEVGHDTLNGFNVNSLVLQVPKRSIRGGSSIIGVWTTAERQSVRVEDSTGTVTPSGNFVQVSRLGMPLVNEVVVPVGLKDYFNASKPADDAQYLPAVQDPELPHVLNAIYGLPVPDSDPGTTGVQRSDLISVFLTGLAGLNQPAGVQGADELRLNMNTPLCATTASCNTLGVIAGDNQGFPNGRRLDDDIIDVALRVVEGVLLPGHPPIVDSLGDGVNANDVSFNPDFPYVAYPHSGSDPSPHS
ncbi:MAG TPA: DUF4331 domain-containing protein [Actinomycetota bacterium]|nr:DUF4331 domain-containing protein [Actinomycetota bacterium]